MLIACFDETICIKFTFGSRTLFTYFGVCYQVSATGTAQKPIQSFAIKRTFFPPTKTKTRYTELFVECQMWLLSTFFFVVFLVHFVQFPPGLTENSNGNRNCAKPNCNQTDENEYCKCN